MAKVFDNLALSEDCDLHTEVERGLREQALQSSLTANSHFFWHVSALLWRNLYIDAEAYERVINAASVLRKRPEDKAFNAKAVKRAAHYLGSVKEIYIGLHSSDSLLNDILTAVMPHIETLDMIRMNAEGKSVFSPSFFHAISKAKRLSMSIISNSLLRSVLLNSKSLRSLRIRNPPLKDSSELVKLLKDLSTRNVLDELALEFSSEDTAEMFSPCVPEIVRTPLAQGLKRLWLTVTVQVDIESLPNLKSLRSLTLEVLDAVKASVSRISNLLRSPFGSQLTSLNLSLMNGSLEHKDILDLQKALTSCEKLQYLNLSLQGNFDLNSKFSLQKFSNLKEFHFMTSEDELELSADSPFLRTIVLTGPIPGFLLSHAKSTSLLNLRCLHLKIQTFRACEDYLSFKAVPNLKELMIITPFTPTKHVGLKDLPKGLVTIYISNLSFDKNEMSHFIAAFGKSIECIDLHLTDSMPALTFLCQKICNGALPRLKGLDVIFSFNMSGDFDLLKIESDMKDLKMNLEEKVPHLYVNFTGPEDADYEDTLSDFEDGDEFDDAEEDEDDDDMADDDVAG